MHLIADQVAARISVPLIHIIDETAVSLKAATRKRPLLLATRYTMEHGFYADRMKRLGVDIMVPDAADSTTVHDIIFNELCAGQVLDSSREKLMQIIEREQRKRRRQHHSRLHRDLPDPRSRRPAAAGLRFDGDPCQGSRRFRAGTATDRSPDGLRMSQVQFS
jgi:hypothetical protein